MAKRKPKKIDTAITILEPAEEMFNSRFGFISNETFCANIQKEFLQNKVEIKLDGRVDYQLKPISTTIEYSMHSGVKHVQLKYCHKKDVPIPIKSNYAGHDYRGVANRSVVVDNIYSKKEESR